MAWTSTSLKWGFGLALAFTVIAGVWLVLLSVDAQMTETEIQRRLMEPVNYAREARFQTGPRHGEVMSGTDRIGTYLEPARSYAESLELPQTEEWLRGQIDKISAGKRLYPSENGAWVHRLAQREYYSLHQLSSESKWWIVKLIGLVWLIVLAQIGFDWLNRTPIRKAPAEFLPEATED